MGQKHVLTMRGRYDQIRETCKFVCDGAREAGFDETAVFHIELACDEACTNIIEHAYGAEDKGQIRVSYEADGAEFIITFQDNGRSFDPATVPEPPSIAYTISTDDLVHETLKVGGLGIHFIRKLMDHVNFHSDPQHGNTLTLIKKIPTDG